VETTCGAGRKTQLDKVYVVVERVSRVPHEIAQRRGGYPQNPNIKPRGLDIGAKWKWCEGWVCGPHWIKSVRWSKVWGGANREIARWEVYPKNPNIEPRGLDTSWERTKDC
jgi:hypothetical protein